MADFYSTAGDDNFVATDGPDRFYFGENQGVDLIVGFNPAQDKLVYTDRSVDGFDDLGISRLSNGDAAVESNDQVTVLQDVAPSKLQDQDFVFTTSGPRYTIERARENNDVPNEVNVRNINQREAQIAAQQGSTGGSNDTGSGGNTGSGGGNGHTNPLADFLAKARLGSGFAQSILSQFHVGNSAPSYSAADVTHMTATGTSLSSLYNAGKDALSLLINEANTSRG